MTNVLLLESNPSGPKDHHALTSLYAISAPLQRVCWPRDLDLSKFTIQKSVGMDIRRFETSFPCVVAFAAPEKLTSITIHTPKMDPSPNHSLIDFTSDSGKSQRIRLLDEKVQIVSALEYTSQTLNFDLANGERLVAIHVLYTVPFALYRPCNTNDIERADGDLVDICFHTSHGQTSKLIASDKQINAPEEFTFVLKAPMGHEIGGLYVTGSWSSTTVGLLTTESLDGNNRGREEAKI